MIAVDEIGTREDVHAIEYAMHCGCKMLATVHAESMEELRKKMDDKKSEETKVLRRLYLLLKQLKNSLKSECMIRVCEVLCQNGSVDISEECVERLSPFHNEMIYGLLLDYVKCVVCFIVK